MIHRVSIVLVFAILCSALSMIGRAQSSQGTLRLDVSLVNVFPSVQNAAGEYVTGLSAKDFRVFEDDVEQKISIFEKDDRVQSAIGLLVDNSGSIDQLRSRIEGLWAVLTSAGARQ